MKNLSSLSAMKKDMKHIGTSLNSLEEKFERLMSQVGNLVAREYFDMRMEGVATKEELEDMREEMLRGNKHLAEEIMSHVDVRFEAWRHDFSIYPEIIKDHGKRISRLETHASFP